MNVVIASDSEAIRQSLVSFVEPHGSVLEVRSVGVVLALCATVGALKQPIHILFLDFQNIDRLSVGMLREARRAALRHAVVVGLIPVNFPDIDGAREAGVTHFLTKPIQSQEVAEFLRQAA